MRNLASLAFLFLFATLASANENIILKQDGCPIEITSYNSSFIAPPREVGNGSIAHRISVENVSGQSVDAYGIGFRTFDAFKRPMGIPFIGYNMDGVGSGQIDKPVWDNRTPSAYLYKRYGTGVTYVAIVRMKDGTIWKANESSIILQLADLELDSLTVEDSKN